MSQSARSPSVPMLERPAARRAVAAIQFKVGLAFAEIRRAATRRSIGRIAAAADDDQHEIDLTPLTKVDVAGALASAGREAGANAIAQVGANPAKHGDSISSIASDLARDRAAEMVGMKRDDDGNLVENPDAKWSVTQSTRAMVRDTIADGLERGATTSEIATVIANSTALSDERAEMIARTEVASITNDVALAAFKQVDADGEIKLKKEWLTSGDDPCDNCQSNEAAGAIGLEDDFPSGDDAPPLHPRCSCEVMPVADED
jgi:SPP1 gp7 family putative phage head morphogenesis protein